MKNILKYSLILLVGVLFFSFQSCDDGLIELNEDPNNPTSVPAVNLFTQAQWAVNNRLWSRGYNAEWSMLMVQQWAQNEYTEEQRYDVDGNDFDVEWLDMYAGWQTSTGGVLNNLKVAKEIIQADEGLNAKLRGNQLAIIKVMEAHTWQNLTDAFGDIPFTQALNPEEFPLPAYDSQQQIYTAILQMMDEAIQEMDESEGSFGSGDIVYGGDMTQWKKLANSLMMRMAMRIVDVDASTASTYINKAAGNMLTSNADNGLFVFDGANASIANPLYFDASIDNRDDFAVSEILVETLRSMGDPRLELYAAETNTGEIIGLPYGLTDAEAFALKSTTSRPHPNVRAASAPAVMMDYAEVQFLLAEAYERGILSGNAADAYAEGITAAMNYWGISDATAIADYVAANPYNAGNWQESIGIQKWLAFYMNGPQAWAEWRRLDYPQLDVPVDATKSFIPVRLPYPISEQTRNETSLSAVASDYNDMSTKLWWDVN